ncbi:MAG: hypothetical protein O7D91_06250 [Planctomycetota bacterium]|nr:hypothetical protein [Planctomycetota bacterium]
MSDHNRGTLDRWHAKGCPYPDGRKLRRKTKYFQIPGQRGRQRRITLQSEAIAITAKRCAESGEQSEQPYRLRCPLRIG